MKPKKNFHRELLAMTLIAAVLSFIALPASAAEDKKLSVAQTNAPANSTNYTTALDLGSTETSDVWSQVYLKGEIPALPNATNSAVTYTYTLQTSTNNSTWANTTTLIQGSIAGATSATNTATTLRLPIPKDVYRYVRVAQGVPASGGDNSTKTNYWRLSASP